MRLNVERAPDETTGQCSSHRNDHGCDVMEIARRTLGTQARGAAFGLAAAALFGLSAPAAKVLLSEISPVLLAGLLYLGAAMGLWLHRAIRPATHEARLVRADVPRLAV